MLKVIEVLSNGNAVVDTSGRYRIIIQPKGEIAGELLSASEAEAFLDGYNDCRTSNRAEAVSYADQISSS